jgi:hypothetical protein
LVRIFTYQFFFKTVALIVLFSLLGANTLVFDQSWKVIADPVTLELELGELADGESEQGEKEKKNEQDRDEKMQTEPFFSGIASTILVVGIVSLENLQAVHHPESPTPPPEYFHSALVV